MNRLTRWLSAKPSARSSAPASKPPRFRPVLQSLDDRITPATLGFASQAQFGVGTGPRGVAIGDFNGDGRPDVVESNSGSTSVSVLVNTGAAGATAAASFAATQDFAVGTTPIGVAVGDFNGDNRPDIATANFGNGSGTTISVLLNTTPFGNGSTVSFSPQQTFSAGSIPLGIAVGDFDGDGRSDLAVTMYLGAGSVVVLLNRTPMQAAASFLVAQSFNVGARPQGVVVADFNADGRADIATANSSSSNVSILLNTTTASTLGFAAQQTFTVGTTPTGLAVGDFNGDGRPDLATANNGTNNVSVLLNQTVAGATTATFAAQTAFAVGSTPYDIVAADLDGDGKTDLATTNTGGGGGTTISVLTNTAAIGAATATFNAQQTFTVGTTPFNLAAADFNGDGRRDLAVGNNGSNNVSVLMNTSTGGTVNPTTLVASFPGYGPYGYDRVTSSFYNLTPATANMVAAAANGNIVANFPGYGVQYYRPQSGWSSISTVPAFALAIDPLGNPYVNFGPSYGSYVYRVNAGGVFNAAGATALVGTSAGADKMVVSENGDLFANFPGFGVYRYRPTTGFVQINGFNATSLAVDANGYVVASFAGFGVGQYIPYASGWRLLTPAVATTLAVDGLGKVFASFAGYGIGRFENVTNTWTNLAPSTAPVSLAADLFGNLFATVNGFGILEYNPFSGWVQRTPSTILNVQLALGR